MMVTPIKTQTEKDIQLCKDVIDNILQKTLIWDSEQLTEKVSLTGNQLKAICVGLELMELKVSTYLKPRDNDVSCCYIALVDLSGPGKEHAYNKDFYVFIGSENSYVTTKGERIEYRINANPNPK